MKRSVLNLGCGVDIRHSTNEFNIYNIDLSVPCDVQANIIYLPFKEASITTVLLLNVIEHIRDIQTLKKECARVLVPKHGVVQILVPHYLSPDAYGDPTHVRFFSHHSWFNHYWPGFIPYKVKKIYPQSPPHYIPLPGLDKKDEDEHVWWDVIMVRNSIPFEIVSKGYDKEFIKMGCGDYAKSNTHTIYD